jgi:hypothetical protein
VKEKGSGGRKKKRGRKKGKGGKIYRDKNRKLIIEKASIKPCSSMKTLFRYCGTEVKRCA